MERTSKQLQGLKRKLIRAKKKVYDIEEQIQEEIISYLESVQPMTVDEDELREIINPIITSVSTLYDPNIFEHVITDYVFYGLEFEQLKEFMRTFSYFCSGDSCCTVNFDTNRKGNVLEFSYIDNDFGRDVPLEILDNLKYSIICIGNKFISLGDWEYDNNDTVVAISFYFTYIHF